MSLAKQTSTGIEKNIRLIESEIEQTSSRWGIRRFRLERTGQVITEKYEHIEGFHVKSIMYLDKKGFAKISLVDQHLQGTDFSSYTFYQRALNAKTDDILYEVVDFKNADINALELILAKPIFDLTENFSGIVVFFIDISALFKEHLSFHLPHLQSWILDSENRILYHSYNSSDTQTDESSKLSNPFKTPIQSAKSKQNYKHEFMIGTGKKC